jgi:signal transduction histidine kinase
VSTASRDTSISAARWLVGVTTAVVIAFVVASLVAQYVQNAIVGRSGMLVTNAMPSVKFLSAVRGNVRTLELEVERGTDAEGERRAAQARAEAARQNIAQELASYEALPYFPHEHDLFTPVIEALAALDADYAAWKASPDLATLDAVQADCALVDDRLERSILFDANEGERLGLEIERVRGGSMTLVMLIDGIAVIVAAGAVLLAMRQLRRAAAVRRADDAEREEREAGLRERNEALGQFAGRVAHDVLSPLSTTMLALDGLRESHPDDKTVLRAAARGTAALQRVHILVDGLLEFSRAGGKPEAGARTELAPALADLVEELGAQAQDRDIALAVGALPAGEVACSPGVLTSITTNLIQNALKYMGDARDRRVVVDALDVGPRYRIEVTDTGPGIPAEQQRRIFEPYVQLARAGGGIGLGLATVDRLVRAHGGTAGVRSQLGVGSTFWFELPKPARVSAPDGPAPGSAPSPRRRSVPAASHAAPAAAPPSRRPG